MEIPVHIEPSRNGDSIRVFCPDLPGCSATARSVEAALVVLRGRISDYFAHGAATPLPAGVRRTVISV